MRRADRPTPRMPADIDPRRTTGAPQAMDRKTMPENPPAFPGVAHFTGAAHHEGMSLRDWFAGQALTATLSRDYGNDWGKGGVEHAPRAARAAYAIADAMLSERNRRDVG